MIGTMILNELDPQRGPHMRFDKNPVFKTLEKFSNLKWAPHLMKNRTKKQYENANRKKKTKIFNEKKFVSRYVNEKPLYEKN